MTHCLQHLEGLFETDRMGFQFIAVLIECQ